MTYAELIKDLQTIKPEQMKEEVYIHDTENDGFHQLLYVGVDDEDSIVLAY